MNVDIICPPGTDIEKYWSMYAGDYGFTLVEAVDRIYRSDVPKTHAKCQYQVSYKTSSDVDTIYQLCMVEVGLILFEILVGYS